MNPYASITRKLSRKKAMLYVLQKASEGDPRYVHCYVDPEKRARKLIAVVKEINELKQRREKVDKKLGVTRNKNGQPKGIKRDKKNVYFDSYGNSWTQKEIDKKRSEAYRQKYGGNPYPRCEETGLRAQCSSHIISQQRCKQLRKTELIWNEANFYPATYEANSRWESNDSTLKRYQKYMNFVKLHDPEGYNKRLNFTK